MYNTTALIAGKLYDDTRNLRIYNEQLLTLVLKEFYKRNISKYDYERFINLLTCINLQVDLMKEKLDDLINSSVKTPGLKVDYKI